MAAPVLNRALLLEARDDRSDGLGGLVAEWRTLGTLWAEIRPRSGRTVAGPGVTVSRAGLRITVRAAPHGAPSRPVPGQRLREGGRIFLVRAVMESDPEARFLRLDCEEEVAS